MFSDSISNLFDHNDSGISRLTRARPVCRMQPTNGITNNRHCKTSSVNMASADIDTPRAIQKHPINVFTNKTATSSMSESAITANTTDNFGWKRLNYKGVYHDNRRLLKHRAKNCECFKCYREIHKLPPAETHEEFVSSLKWKIKQREIKQIQKKAKKDVKAGKQRPIDQLFQRI